VSLYSALLSGQISEREKQFLPECLDFEPLSYTPISAAVLAPHLAPTSPHHSTLDHQLARLGPSANYQLVDFVLLLICTQEHHQLTNLRRSFSPPDATDSLTSTTS